MNYFNAKRTIITSIITLLVAVSSLFVVGVFSNMKANTPKTENPIAAYEYDHEGYSILVDYDNDGSSDNAISFVEFNDWINDETTRKNSYTYTLRGNVDLTEWYTFSGLGYGYKYDNKNYDQRTGFTGVFNGNGLKITAKLYIPVQERYFLPGAKIAFFNFELFGVIKNLSLSLTVNIPNLPYSYLNTNNPACGGLLRDFYYGSIENCKLDMAFNSNEPSQATERIMWTVSPICVLWFPDKVAGGGVHGGVVKNCEINCRFTDDYAISRKSLVGYIARSPQGNYTPKIENVYCSGIDELFRAGDSVNTTRYVSKNCPVKGTETVEYNYALSVSVKNCYNSWTENEMPFDSCGGKYEGYDSKVWFCGKDADSKVVGPYLTTFMTWKPVSIRTSINPLPGMSQATANRADSLEMINATTIYTPNYYYSLPTPTPATRDGSGNVTKQGQKQFEIYGQVVKAKDNSDDSSIGCRFIEWLYDTTWHTYTACFDILEFNIVADPNNGQALRNQKYNVTDYSIDILSPSPTKIGYNFSYWKDKSTGSKFTYVRGETAGDKELIAEYVGIASKLFIDPNGGSFSVDGGSKIYAYRSFPNTYGTTIEIEAFAPEGYEFAGWQRENAVKGSKISPNVNSDVITYSYGLEYGEETLTATWIPIDYTISYKFQKTNNYDTPTAPTSSGYNNTDETYRTYNIESNFTIGSSNYEIEGYTFDHWELETAKTGFTLSSDKKSIKVGPGSYGSTVTLVSYFTADLYTITYNYNDNDASGKKSTTPNTKTSYTVDTPNFTLSNPTREGFTFKGWSGTGIAGRSTNVTVSKGSTGYRTYTANWEAIPYDITYQYYKVNNHSSVNRTWGPYTDITQSPATYNVLSNTTIGEGTKNIAGYEFKYWKLAKAKWGHLAYYENDTISIIPGYTGEITITGYWEAIVYNVELDYNDIGTGIEAGMPISNRPSYTSTYTIDTADFTLPTPTRTGYDFIGWTGSNGNTPQKTVKISKGSTGNKSYVANWELHHYTLTCYPDNNLADPNESFKSYYTIADTKQGIKDRLETASGGPEKRGHTFMYWDDLGTATVAEFAFTRGGTTIGDKTFKAIYFRNKSEVTINSTGNKLSVATYNVSIVDNDNCEYEHESTHLNGVPGAYSSETFEGCYEDQIKIDFDDCRGYDFVGWTENLDSANESVFTSTSKDNSLYTFGIKHGAEETLTANWKPHPYSITYKCVIIHRDGSQTETDYTSYMASLDEQYIKYTIEDNFTIPRGGYIQGRTFSHWELQPVNWGYSSGAKPREINVVQGHIGDMVIVGYWTTNVYDITYYQKIDNNDPYIMDINDLDASVDTTKYIADYTIDDYKEIPFPMIDGMKPMGWNVEISDNDSKYDNDSDYWYDDTVSADSLYFRYEDGGIIVGHVTLTAKHHNVFVTVKMINAEDSEFEESPVRNNVVLDRMYGKNLYVTYSTAGITITLTRPAGAANEVISYTPKKYTAPTTGNPIQSHYVSEYVVTDKEAGDTELYNSSPQINGAEILASLDIVVTVLIKDYEFDFN